MLLLALLFVACSTAPSAPILEDVRVEATDVASVFRVRWTTSEPADAMVECDDGTVRPKQANGESTADGLEHVVVLAGLGEGTSWSCVAFSSGGESEPFTIDTPSGPPNLPDFVMTVPNTSDLDGFMLVAQPRTPTSVTILDREGRRTWWYEGDEDDSFNEAWLTADGQAIWFQSIGEPKAFHRISLDGSEALTLEIDETHHDFYASEQGGFYAIVNETRPVTYQGKTWQVSGDALVEFDEAGAEVRVVWNAWDALTLDLTQLPADANQYDWTHLNCIRPAEDDTWLLSLWSLRAILRIKNSDGSLVWRFGDGGDFEMLDDAELFDGQHGVELRGDTLSVFSNRNRDQSDAADLWSEAIEYTLDQEAMTAERTWSYDAGKRIYSTALGELTTRENGNRFVNWGVAGRLTELDEADEIVWQVDTDLGGTFGYGHEILSLAGATR